MPKKLPARKQITMKRGGYGLLETGEIVRTVACSYTVGKLVITGQRHIVQMNNQRGAFGASTRFLWAEFPQTVERAA